MNDYKNISKDVILDYLKTVKPYFLNLGIKKVALFGSFADKNNNIYSDIDIAIKKDENFLKNFTPYDYFEIVNELKSKLRKRFKREIDIFDLDSKSPFLKSIEDRLEYV